MPAGRPTKLTPEAIEKAIDYINVEPEKMSILCIGGEFAGERLYYQGERLTLLKRDPLPDINEYLNGNTVCRDAPEHEVYVRKVIGAGNFSAEVWALEGMDYADILKELLENYKCRKADPQS